MWPGHEWGFNWGMMLVGGLLMLLFWIGVIALVFFAIRALTRPSRGPEEGGNLPSPSQTALEILQQRYARGELTREEYLEIKRDIET
jgi:putative membrane protein